MIIARYDVILYQSEHVLLCNHLSNYNKMDYYIDRSVFVENRALEKFILNYTQDLSGIFSISSLARISVTSFPAFTLLFVQKYSCLYNKKKITRWLEDMNFIFLVSSCVISSIYRYVLFFLRQAFLTTTYVTE